MIQDIDIVYNISANYVDKKFRHFFLSAYSVYADKHLSAYTPYEDKKLSAYTLYADKAKLLYVPF